MKYIILLAFISINTNLFSQPNFNIRKKDKSILQIPINLIDSVSFNIDNGSQFNPDLTYGTVTDIENNTYRTIQIGTQVWMAENLKVSKYNNGVTIPNITDKNEWANTSSGAWCYFNNNPSYNLHYGKLYNLFAVINSNKLCPTGWHVPTDNEWSILINYLDPFLNGGYDDNAVGGKLKSTGTQFWKSPNADATNSSGLSLLPGGARGNLGDFGVIGTTGALTAAGFFWASTFGAYRHVKSTDGIVGRLSYGNEVGFSVRCMKD